MRVVFLGTGNAFSTGERSHVGILLPEKNILLDCPPDILFKLKRIHYRPEDLRYILLSHLHGDHILGTPFILLHSRFRGEGSPPRFLVRRGGRDLIFQLTSLVYPEMKGEWLSQVEVMEIDPGEYVLEDFTLQVIETEHIIPNYSFRLKIGDKMITYSGDTGTDITELARGSDLLIHEVSAKEDGTRIHVSLREALEVFYKSGSKRLALVHVYQGIEKEMEKIADERIILPSDLESLEI